MSLGAPTVDDLLTSIAAKTPSPGGGAVASLTAAIGAALAQMVVSYSRGKKTLAAHDDLHADAQRTLDALRQSALDLAEEDAIAYARLNELWRLDDGDERKRREMPAAVTAAIDVPRRVVRASLDLLDLLERLCGRTNVHLASDLAIAAILADAAACAGNWNVRINLPLVEDADETRSLEAEIDATTREARELRDAIERACRGVHGD